MIRGVAAAVLLVTGCGAPRSYMGIDLARGSLAPLAQRARGGDQAAMLDLGRAFEDGAGVQRDLDRACRLYRAAGVSTGGTIFLYQPRIGNAPARVMPVDTGPVRPGLAVAGERLTSLAYRATAGDLAGSACLRGARPR